MVAKIPNGQQKEVHPATLPCASAVSFENEKRLELEHHYLRKGRRLEPVDVQTNLKQPTAIQSIDRQWHYLSVCS